VKTLLTVKEAASALAMGVPTLRRWIAERKVASVKLGTRSVRVPADEIARIIEGGSMPRREKADV
jgi:excisionase family DNA binding protein